MTRVHRRNAKSQPSREEEEELAPTSSIRRPRWFEQTLRDAREHFDAPRSTFSERRPPRNFPNYMALYLNQALRMYRYQPEQNSMAWREMAGMKQPYLLFY